MTRRLLLAASILLVACAGDSNRDRPDTPAAQRQRTQLEPLPVDVVIIRGCVYSPGVYALRRGSSVIELVHRAGGLTNVASPAETYVTRRAPAGEHRISANLVAVERGWVRRFVLVEGDVIVVPERTEEDIIPTPRYVQLDPEMLKRIPGAPGR